VARGTVAVKEKYELACRQPEGIPSDAIVELDRAVEQLNAVWRCWKTASWDRMTPLRRDET
jgi:hypothetical protein